MPEKELETIHELVQHHYFQTLLDKEVDKRARRYWKRWWAGFVAVATGASIVLAFFGFQSFNKFKELDDAFSIQSARLEQTSEGLERTSTQLESTVQDAEEQLQDAKNQLTSASELRTETNSLVSRSIDAVSSANNHNLDAQHSIALVEDRLRFVERQADTLQYLRERLTPLEGTLRTLNTTLTEQIDVSAGQIEQYEKFSQLEGRMVALDSTLGLFESPAVFVTSQRGGVTYLELNFEIKANKVECDDRPTLEGLTVTVSDGSDNGPEMGPVDLQLNGSDVATAPDGREFELRFAQCLDLLGSRDLGVLRIRQLTGPDQVE